MFTFGGTEFLIIVVLVLLLFGPDKIPQLARTIGRFTREFNKYKDIMESTIRMEISRAEEPAEDKITVEERIAKASAASQALLEERAEPPAQESAAAAALSVGDEADEEDEG